MNRILTLVFVAFAFVLSGCAEPVKTDYTAFKASKPKSILVLLPKNQTPEVEAAHSFLSQVTYPWRKLAIMFFLSPLLKRPLNKMVCQQEAISKR